MATNSDIGLCVSCGKATTEQLVCPGCGVVQSDVEEPDYFSLFGLPRTLVVDLETLAERYYALSRRLHPDLYQDRPAAERDASLRGTALVNRAYGTLKDPMRRALYWLSLHGESLGRDNERVPPELAALVFGLQEKLEERRVARGAALAALDGELRQAQADLRTRMRALEERLVSGFTGGDGATALAQTKRVLSELHYLRTLVRDVEKELEPEWNA